MNDLRVGFFDVLLLVSDARKVIGNSYYNVVVLGG